MELLVAFLLWAVMATTTTMLVANAFTKVGAATNSEVEPPVCEESLSSTERDPPRILTDGSFRDLQDLASFEPITTISYDTLLDGEHRGMPREDDATNNSNNPTRVASIPGGEPIDLRYVRDLVSEATAAAGASAPTASVSFAPPTSDAGVAVSSPPRGAIGIKCVFFKETAETISPTCDFAPPSTPTKTRAEHRHLR